MNDRNIVQKSYYKATLSYTVDIKMTASPGDYVDPFGSHQCTLAVSTNVPWETPKMMLVGYVFNFVVVVVV